MTDILIFGLIFGAAHGLIFGWVIGYRQGSREVICPDCEVGEPHMCPLADLQEATR